MPVWQFWLIEILIIVVFAFLGFAANRWMMSYDPSKTMMYTAIGAVIGIIVAVLVWYFIKDRIDWGSSGSRFYPPPDIRMSKY